MVIVNDAQKCRDSVIGSAESSRLAQWVALRLSIAEHWSSKEDQYSNCFLLTPLDADCGHAPALNSETPVRVD